MRRSLLPGAVLLAVLPAAARGQIRAGAEFQVNSYTFNAQFGPAVAADANGNFVVVWTSVGQDGSINGLVGRRFDAAGTPRGSEFQVNTYTTGYQFQAAVASDADGNFVVVWVSTGQDGSADGVFGQRFDANGVRQGGEFLVNSYTTGDQHSAGVAAGANGDFVVVWSSDDGSLEGIFAQRFNASGTPQGAEFPVNTFTPSRQFMPAVAADTSGNFVVVWQSYANDGSQYGIFGQRFDAAGTPQGSEFRANSYTTGAQLLPHVAADASGAFVVAWESFAQDGSSTGLFGQRFDATGIPRGGEFQINSYTTSYQVNPVVASDAHGDFVVVWTSYSGQDGNATGVFGRHFDASGAPFGADFQVNSYTTGYQTRAVVASSAHGDFVVAWDSDPQEGSSLGVFGQRYSDLIFKDGFETGDLSRWSAASTGGGDLSVSGAASMAGTVFGLQALVDDTGALYVQDDTPSGENRYRARFYFDPNGFDPGEAQSHFRTRIFIAFDNTPVRVMTLVLKRQGGAYSVEGRVRRNDGTRADTGFFPITDGPHFFEVDWRRASAPAALDGSFTLLIDNSVASTLTALDNDSSPVDFARMGAFSIKTGAAGTLYFDQFESRRQVFIGPE